MLIDSSLEMNPEEMLLHWTESVNTVTVIMIITALYQLLQDNAKWFWCALLPKLYCLSNGIYITNNSFLHNHMTKHTAKPSLIHTAHFVHYSVQGADDKHRKDTALQGAKSL